jgi:hypothetical protein
VKLADHVMDALRYCLQAELGDAGYPRGEGVEERV